MLDLGNTTQTTGELTLTGGTLQNGTLNSASFGVQAGTVSAVLAGTGALTKTGTGTVTLSAANTYSGTTTVTVGTLALTGSLANSAVTVVGGAFGGNGTAKPVTVQWGDKVAPGVLTLFSTLNVSGNASFAAGSTFAVNINSAGQNDKLAVGGTATINGGTVQVLGGTGITAASTFTILTAASVTGSGFTKVTRPSPSSRRSLRKI